MNLAHITRKANTGTASISRFTGPIIVIIAVATIWAMLSGGPALSSHEVIVAQIARQILETEDWIVLRYLDAPFLIKPPLPPWLVAIAGSIMPHDQISGLPVTNAAARLPSVIAFLLTLLIVYKLASSMYGRSIARCAAFIYVSSIGTLLFAFNATAEALLTLFCTWSFAELWWAMNARRNSRIAHLLKFYIAFGLAMLAKGPMPLSVLVVPLAVWFILEKPSRFIAAGGYRSPSNLFRLVLTSTCARIRFAITKLGLWWGLPLSALIFLPWMFAAAKRIPYFWQLWDSEYLTRFHGTGVWDAKTDYFYYLPTLFGLVVPWCLSLPEALLSPWIARYRSQRRGLIFAWFWLVTTTLVLSVMTFKQYYYLIPAVPGAALLLAPVLHHLFFGQIAAAPRMLKVALFVLIPIGGIVSWIFLWHFMKSSWTGSILVYTTILIVLGLALLEFAVWSFFAGRRSYSFRAVGITAIAGFALAWITLGPRIGNVDEQLALVRALHSQTNGEEMEVYWTSNIPDGRVTFYGQQPIRQIVDSFELKASHKHLDMDELLMEAGSRTNELLSQSKPVLLVFERGRYKLFSSMFSHKGYIWFEIDRLPHGNDSDDWLVVSNVPRRS